MTGKFATSKAGHDKGKLYVIVACDTEYVWLADGIYKTVEAPKKKRLKHIQIIQETVGEELTEQIKAKKLHLNEAVKYAIKCRMAENR